MSSDGRRGENGDKCINVQVALINREKEGGGGKEYSRINFFIYRSYMDEWASGVSGWVSDGSTSLPWEKRKRAILYNTSCTLDTIRTDPLVLLCSQLN